MGNKRVYETFDAALARFRLMPEQLCDNPYIVEFIGRHSLRRTEGGWVWTSTARPWARVALASPYASTYRP